MREVGLLLEVEVAVELIKAARIMIAILIILFATRIVLSSRSGFESSLSAVKASLPLAVLKLLHVVWSKRKVGYFRP